MLRMASKAFVACSGLRSRHIIQAAGILSSAISGRSALQSDLLSPAAPEYAIEAQDVCISLGGKQVLNKTSLKVQAGSLHILLGPNACGKSTLLRVLGGLLKPDAGTIRVHGSVGYVFQNPDHQVVMPTVAADVAFGLGRLKLSKAEVHARVLTALTLVGMGGYLERGCHTLSGGQKQRVAIAGALVQRPKVLLLDELTTFLEAEDQAAVLQAVQAIVRGPDKVTALWVTHRLEELQHADAATFLDGGKVQVSGGVERVVRLLRRRGAPVG